MKKYFFVFVIIFIFLNLFVVSAQDNNETINSTNDLIKSFDVDKNSINESPAVSIETHVSENPIYIGNQTEVNVSVRNVGNVDVDNLTICEVATARDDPWFALNGYSEDYEALNLTAFESIDYWEYNISDHSRTHDFTLKHTLKVNESSSFKLIYNTSKIRDYFYKKNNIFLDIHLKDTSLTFLNKTNVTINVSQIPRDVHINRKIENNSLIVDVNVSSLDNSIFSGNIYIDVLRGIESRISHLLKVNTFNINLDSILIINNTGHASFELPIKIDIVQKDWHWHGYYQYEFQEPLFVYSKNFIFDEFDVNSILLDINYRDIKAENLVKYYKNDSQFIVKIPYSQKNVTFKVNGVSYIRSINDGYAKLNINLPPGIYTIEIIGDSVNYDTFTRKITVLPTFVGDDLIKYYGNVSPYHIKLVDYAGNPVKDGYVSFHINGVYYHRMTNSDGIATLNINLPPNDYIITAYYQGCEISDTKISNNIKVLPVLNAEDILMNYLDGTQFKANLVDGQGKPYKNQMVTFNVNGVFYNRLTDSNGQVALNIRLIPGEYIITSSFNGCNIANKITITG